MSMSDRYQFAPNVLAASVGFEGQPYALQIDTGNKEYKTIALIRCSEQTAELIDSALNRPARAGRVSSEAKTAAAKRNAMKRWAKSHDNTMEMLENAVETERHNGN